MKVFTAKAMSQLESEAYQQGNSEHEFMEKAGYGISLAIQDFIQRHSSINHIVLLAGKGNNGGDAFVAGCYLLENGYSVSAVQLEEFSHCSPLCKKNGKRFLDRGGKISRQLICSPGTLLVDGLFGTGFKGTAKQPYASLIEQANTSLCPILAIDIPSGLNGSTGEIEGAVIQAAETIFLGHPKTGFFLRDGWNKVGTLRFVDFGLPADISDKAIADFILMTPSFIKDILPPLKRNRHKYQAGYVIGLAGSPSMPGAALLSSLAALRAGSGMVRLLHPKGMETELANSPYELIKVPYSVDDPESVLQWLQKGSAAFAGPGLGKSDAVKKLLQTTLQKLEKPCVIDADALILFAEEPFKLPPHTIFTPHTGEMQALLHETTHLIPSEPVLQICQEFAEQHAITLILKGAPTFIFHPGEPILVNPTGNPGMATAGSGDVLTGIIASLLSQGLNNRQAAAVGVYLHGLAGDCAAEKRASKRGLIASDLITHLNDAYSLLEKGSI